jgi:hypothetical protein
LSPTHNLFLAAIKAQRLKWQQMQESLKINPETAELLTTQASERGLSIEDYLKSLLGVSPESMPSTLEECMSAMESLAEDVEPLPRDFSREDSYFSWTVR